MRWNPLVRRAKPAPPLLAGRAAPLVLLEYHRIARHPRDSFRLDVSPRHFGEHLEVLRRHAEVIPLRDLERSRPSAPAVALTFDDGYADFSTAALPLLREAGAAATVFAVADAIESGAEFWWDRLERAILEPERMPSTLELQCAGERLAFEVDSHSFAPESAAWRDWSMASAECPSPRHSLLRSLVERIGRLGDQDRQSSLRAIERWAELDAGPRDAYRPLSPEELVAVSRAPGIEVGAHTCTHPVLARLVAAAQASEIAASKAKLEGRLGQPVVAFAYPHGGSEHYSATTVALVRESGFRFACTSLPGRVEATTSRLELPRHIVFDWSGAEFEQRLLGWLRDPA